MASNKDDTVTRISPARSVSEPTAGGTTLTVALPSFGTETLDPSMDGRGGLLYHGHMFDHLLGAAPEGRLNTDFGVLQRWEISPDARTYTLTLKDGIKWHDGKEATSGDIDFGLAYYARESAACEVCPLIRDTLARVEIVDARRVKLHLKRPDVTFTHILGPVEGDVPLLPRHRGQLEGGRGLEERPLGTGPWKFAARTLGSTIDYAANRDYWNPERVPGFDRLRLIQVPDADVRIAMLRTGQVDVTVLRLGDVDPVREEGFTIQGPKYVMATTLRFFMSYDPAYLTSNVKFRRALVHAIDLDSIIDKVYPPEAASVPTGAPLFTPLSDGYDPDLPPYPYDPEGATKLLRESGYRGETVELFSIAAYGLTEMLEINELIAQYWRRVGLDVRIISTTFPSVQARYVTRPQEFDDVAPAPLFHGAFPNRPDVLSTVRRYMTSEAPSVLAYHDPARGDRIYQELAVLADPEERDRRLRELNRELYEEYWAADIVWRHEVYGLSPRVEGWEPTNGSSSDLHLETLRPVQ